MTKPDTSELKKTKQCKQTGELKTWSSAEPNLPPEVVDWDHLIQRGTDGEKETTVDVLIKVVAARYSISSSIACDAVDEAVYLGLLEALDDQLKLSTEPDKEMEYNER